MAQNRFDREHMHNYTCEFYWNSNYNIRIYLQMYHQITIWITKIQSYGTFRIDHSDISQILGIHYV